MRKNRTLLSALLNSYRNIFSYSCCISSYCGNAEYVYFSQYVAKMIEYSYRITIEPDSDRISLSDFGSDWRVIRPDWSNKHPCHTAVSKNPLLLWLLVMLRTVTCMGGYNSTVCSTFMAICGLVNIHDKMLVQNV